MPKCFSICFQNWKTPLGRTQYAATLSQLSSDLLFLIFMDSLGAICAPKGPTITGLSHYYYLLNGSFTVSSRYWNTIAAVQGLTYHLLYKYLSF